MKLIKGANILIRLKSRQVCLLQSYGDMHTQGHLSFLINEKYLCTGDLLLLKDGKVKPFYKVWNNDHNLDKESVKSIAKFEGVEAVCTAHSKSTLDFRKAFEEWI